MLSVQCSLVLDQETREVAKNFEASNPFKGSVDRRCSARAAQGQIQDVTCARVLARWGRLISTQEK